MSTSEKQKDPAGNVARLESDDDMYIGGVVCFVAVERSTIDVPVRCTPVRIQILNVSTAVACAGIRCVYMNMSTPRDGSKVLMPNPSGFIGLQITLVLVASLPQVEEA